MQTHNDQDFTILIRRMPDDPHCLRISIGEGLVFRGNPGDVTELLKRSVAAMCDRPMKSEQNMALSVCKKLVLFDSESAASKGGQSNISFKDLILEAKVAIKHHQIFPDEEEDEEG